jgi:hypothetical protein
MRLRRLRRCLDDPAPIDGGDVNVPEPGWLARQLKWIKEDSKTWPSWLKETGVIYMSNLINEALAETDGDLLENFRWSDEGSPSHAARFRLLKALGETGPLFHDGRVYRAGEGETYNEVIEVIEGVRIASEVPVPADVA